ncbi:PTS system cellobiose-specific IIC component [Buttiauxella gaviniae ATCC 51604]|uniref:PTS system cellobiose-specific IIC component n=1 Tax=Buttiauxella gaviniae ATCC 51604 TaxID=1354253 RepID=A0A1B7I3L6_9ENTR|nr:PTS system cellobiose-specific IIC component [Buttiauxella gaviniae ATCC 51604]
MALQEKLIDSLGSFATKFNSYRYIMAIKSSFITLMPVIIVGAYEEVNFFRYCQELVCFF